MRAKLSRHLPVVLTPGEAKDVLSQLQGEYLLIVSLLYGAGLKLREALTLRVKDLQFEYRRLIGRSGKGGKDRSAIRPDALVAPLQKHLVGVKALHLHAIEHGYAGVELPHAIERTRDPRSGAWRRHHLYPEFVQELLGHKDVETTQIYTHVMRRGANAVQSPLDR